MSVTPEKQAALALAQQLIDGTGADYDDRRMDDLLAQMRTVKEQLSIQSKAAADAKQAMRAYENDEMVIIKADKAFKNDAERKAELARRLGSDPEYARLQSLCEPAEQAAQSLALDLEMLEKEFSKTRARVMFAAGKLFLMAGLVMPTRDNGHG
ncbi:hypothetical protein H1S01_03105 [Heliobacterium chlorum]|uniref:Uncharacterized protein n=1 Tax=Heliobacterium chlorum TaxID=2698 RepID=A0ABR7SYA1_HELCL|nr:hypothetical protein [Heliobacterium chlorum]MBC9783499.1 hypothetical protein [Heliobacterium chlorum]